MATYRTTYKTVRYKVLKPKGGWIWQTKTIRVRYRVS